LGTIDRFDIITYCKLYNADIPKRLFTFGNEFADKKLELAFFNCNMKYVYVG